jgi:hypothetical protein
MINPKIKDLADKAFKTNMPNDYYLQIEKELYDFWDNEATEEDKKAVQNEWHFEFLANVCGMIKHELNIKDEREHKDRVTIKVR